MQTHPGQENLAMPKVREVSFATVFCSGGLQSFIKKGKRSVSEGHFQAMLAVSLSCLTLLAKVDILFQKFEWFWKKSTLHFSVDAPRQ